QALDHQIEEGLRDRTPTEHLCPHCDERLERGQLMDRSASVERCSACGGLWFQASELERAVDDAPVFESQDGEPVVGADASARAAAQERVHALSAGLLRLPNLFLRSALVLVFLYGLLGIILIAMVQFKLIGPTLALAIGVVFALIQFTVSPWIMDFLLKFIYKFRWLHPNELPEHLRD